MLVKEKEALKEINIIRDKNYIIQELKDSESEKSYSFENSYKFWIDYISKL